MAPQSPSNDPAASPLTDPSSASENLPLDVASLAGTSVVSGRYEGEMSTPSSGLELLDLRVDVDIRYPNSPVMNRVSGDFYQLNKISVPGSPPKVSRVYRESWIVNEPVVTNSVDKVVINGSVEFWKGIHPPNVVEITILRSQPGITQSALVSFTQSGGQPSVYNCARKSDCFRDLALDMDVCDSVNTAPLLPTYDTSFHPTRPSGLPARVLSIPEAYREAGVAVSLSAEPNVIDDSDPAFETWSAAELHHVMETYFDSVNGPWPQWALWGVLAGNYDVPTVGGIMFDAAAALGAPGSAPERQGFAVFRNHFWFNDLNVAVPANENEAAAARQFLYTWVHEAGHAFNLLHSWKKNRPNALSWMNYDWQYDRLHGENSFWSDFNFRFDDEELIHLRHGDRSSVIMGGDPWSSGGHMEAPPGSEYLAAPPGAMSSLDGAAPMELLIRSKSYFEFMEPVSIELRIRNLFPDLSLTLDTSLNPEYGGVVIYIRRPDGRIVEYSPIMCKLAISSPRTLKPLQADTELGEDRYSEEVPLSYGRYGFYFDQPGQYAIRALYQGAGDLLIPSNVHRLRVGNPLTKDLDVTAQDYFSYEVGMNLYLEGSRSTFLEKGWSVLAEISEKYSDTFLGAKIATTVANSFARPFFSFANKRIAEGEKQDLKLEKLHDADPERALRFTDEAIKVMRSSQIKSLNLFYRQLVGLRVECLLDMQEPNEAQEEFLELREHLSKNGANEPVLRQIQELADSVDHLNREKPHRLWERVRSQDRIASGLMDEPLNG